MISVKLHYQDGILTGIESRGHSDYSHRGSDIVCAAVSALMQALMLGLEDIVKVQSLEVEADERVPVIRIAWPVTEQERLSPLTETIASSLKQIALENPKHVRIITEDK